MNSFHTEGKGKIGTVQICVEAQFLMRWHLYVEWTWQVGVPAQAFHML